MQYDIFISYSRKDNKNCRVTELKEKIEADYFEFSNEELKCFFDKDEILGMEDWKHRLLQGLKDSHLLLVILSPNYLDSPYCEWEVVEYLKYEYSRAVQGEGIAQIYFLEIPGLDDPNFMEKAKVWLEKINRRERIDLRPWFETGADSLKNNDVKNRLEELKKSLHNRIAKMRRIAKAPGNLPAPNARFVGREREMKLLHESVGLGKLGIITALHGIGGLGKTTIAFQYAYAYADFYPGGRWQIGCAGETNLAAVLKKLDLDLEITFTEDEKKDDLRGAKRILNELKTLAIKGAESRTGEKHPPKPSVLLVLDNVDHAELIQFPNADLFSGKEWLKILVTTRMGQEELGADETKQSLLTIDELPFDDALSLIESYQPKGRFKNEEEKEKAGEIVKLLGGFTLAVEVAALYLYERKGQITCAAFFELLKREGGISGVDIAGTKTSTTLNHTKLISATLTPTLNMLSPTETLILNYASLLPPDLIPVPWLRAIVSKQCPEFETDALAGLDDPWLSNINHLLSLRILQIVELDDEVLKPRIVRMHKLIQNLLEDKLIEGREKLINKLLEFTRERADLLMDTWVNIKERWEISPIKTASLYWMKRDLISSAGIANQIQWVLSNLGYFTEAKELLNDAIKIYESKKESYQSDLAVNYNDLALIERELSNNNEARILLLKAIEIYEKIYEPGHQFFSTTYSNLALVDIELGNYVEAKELLKKSIDICKQNLEPNNPSLATRYSNLAMVERKLGNFRKAKKLILLAKLIIEQNYDEYHPKYALIESNLATVENDLGHLKEAKKLLIKTISVEEKVFSNLHPTLATSYTHLGEIEKKLKNISEAEKLFCKALEIREKLLPPGHKFTLDSYKKLITLFEEQNRNIESKELRLRAKEHGFGEI